METYYLHDYDIDGSGVRLVYLRKADGIDPQIKTDELDAYLNGKILQQYPNASENIEVIARKQNIQKWDDMLLKYRHLTANYLCATSVMGFTFITINYASLLIPMNVFPIKYESVGRHGSMTYADYNRIFIAKATNPPILLHQHPLIHGITCYREFEPQTSQEPEYVYFMYHYDSVYIRAEVNVIKRMVELTYNNNPQDVEIIDKDLYNLKNGMLISLKLNKEKELYKTAKQLLMSMLAKHNTPVDKDFERYLLYADEL